MKSLKYILSVLLMLSIAGGALTARADEGKGCDVEEIESPTDPITGLLTIPFKAITAITFGPRCLLSQIPEPKSE